MKIASNIKVYNNTNLLLPCCSERHNYKLIIKSHKQKYYITNLYFIIISLEWLDQKLKYFIVP